LMVGTPGFSGRTLGGPTVDIFYVLMVGAPEFSGNTPGVPTSTFLSIDSGCSQILQHRLLRGATVDVLHKVVVIPRLLATPPREPLQCILPLQA
jgi:hypothetical protein